MRQVLFIVPAFNTDIRSGISLQFSTILSIISEARVSLMAGLAGVRSSGNKYVISLADTDYPAGAALQNTNGLQGFVGMQHPEQQVGKQFF